MGIKDAPIAPQQPSPSYLVDLLVGFERETGKPVLELVFSDKQESSMILGVDGRGDETLLSIPLIFLTRMPILDVANFFRQAADHLEQEAGGQEGVKPIGGNGNGKTSI